MREIPEFGEVGLGGQMLTDVIKASALDRTAWRHLPPAPPSLKQCSTEQKVYEGEGEEAGEGENTSGRRK